MCGEGRGAQSCDVVSVSRGMRSGTVPHTLAVGLGTACEIAQQEMQVGVIRPVSMAMSTHFWLHVYLG